MGWCQCGGRKGLGVVLPSDAVEWLGVVSLDLCLGSVRLVYMWGAQSSFFHHENTWVWSGWLHFWIVFAHMHTKILWFHHILGYHGYTHVTACDVCQSIFHKFFCHLQFNWIKRGTCECEWSRQRGIREKEEVARALVVSWFVVLNACLPWDIFCVHESSIAQV